VLIVRAIERGLSLDAFENMTVGMIIGYITTYNDLYRNDEEKEEEVRMAGQSDFDSF
jgi:hypothetical protein